MKLHEAIPVDLNVGKSLFGQNQYFNDYLNQDYEKDEKYEHYLYSLITKWYNGSGNVATTLFKQRDAIKKLSKKYPNVFSFDSNVMVYRYLPITNKFSGQIQNLIEQIQHNKKIPKNKLFVYKGSLIIKNISYKSHSKLTSWTINDILFFNKIKWYDDIGIITKSNSDFCMNPIVSTFYDFDEEQEIIHFGNEFNQNVHLIFHPSLLNGWKIFPQAKEINDLNQLF